MLLLGISTELSDFTGKYFCFREVLIKVRCYTARVQIDHFVRYINHVCTNIGYKIYLLDELDV